VVLPGQIVDGDIAAVSKAKPEREPNKLVDMLTIESVVNDPFCWRGGWVTEWADLLTK
jgi:hypothetical protein